MGCSVMGGGVAKSDTATNVSIINADFSISLCMTF
jgi:hypothetical protein